MNMTSERIYGILCIIFSILLFPLSILMLFFSAEVFTIISALLLLIQPTIIFIANRSLKTKVWYKSTVLVLSASSLTYLIALGVWTFVYIPNYAEPSLIRGIIYMFGEIAFAAWCIITSIVLFEGIFFYFRKRSSLIVITVGKRAKIVAISCVTGALLMMVMSFTAYLVLKPETVKIRGEKYLVGEEYYYTLNTETDTVTLNQIINPKQENVTIPDNIGGHTVDTIGTVADKPVLYMPKRLGLFENNKFIKTVIVPDSIQYIERETFMESTVERVTIEGDINEICQATFSGCTNLEEVVFKGSVSIIGNYAFSSTGLKEITLPNEVERIEFGAFWYNEKLEKIVIGDKVTHIEDNAFNNSPNLTIYGSKDSYAEKYANKHDIPFEEFMI